MKVAAASWVAAIAVLGIALLLPLEPDDTNQEWVLLKAATAGLDVSRPVVELALALNLEGVHSTYPVARPPGFFALYLPTLPHTAIAETVVTVLNAVAIGYLIHAARQMTGAGGWMTAAMSLACLILATGMVRYNNPTLIWSALIVATWKHMNGNWLWGIPLGIVTAVRLWPGLPLVWLMTRRRPTGFGAALTAAVLTLAGLLIVPSQTAMASILGGQVWADHHPQNLSLSWLLTDLGIPVTVTIAIGGLLALWFARNTKFGFGYTLIAAIFLSPITWPVYLTATVPIWPVLVTNKKPRPLS